MAGKAKKYEVFVQVHGRAGKQVKVNAGATVRSALVAAGTKPGELEAMEGEIRLNSDEAGMNTRIPKGAFITVTPKAAGGR